MTLEEAIRKAREVHESHAEMVWTAKYLREVIDALEPFYGQAINYWNDGYSRAQSAIGDSYAAIGDSYDEVSRSYEKLP